MQVVDLYSTTPAIEQNQLVVLEDPKNMILAQQVLPIINTSRVPDSAAEVLNRVSAKLTTADLRTLNAVSYTHLDVYKRQVHRRHV